jgi:hypothetical protein
MATQVLGSGPVGFTDSTGNQVFIPLSKLYFDDANKIQAGNWELYTANQKTVDALLKELVEGGFLLPGTEPPIKPKPAMLIESAISGAVGNHIQVAFSNIVVDSATPANSTFECSITAKDTYPDLKWDSIETVLGIKTPTLSLVNVKNVKSSLPKKGIYNLTGGGIGTKASKEIDDDGDPSGIAFTLEAWKEGLDGNNITATISQVDTNAKTFTVIVEWKQIITGIAVVDLPTKLAGDGLVLKVSKPKEPKDAEFAIPMVRTIILNGGEDAKAATQASAIAIAQS